MDFHIFFWRNIGYQSIFGWSRRGPAQYTGVSVTDWLTDWALFAEHFVSEELREDPTDLTQSGLPIAPRVCSTISGSLWNCYILSLFAVSMLVALAWRPLCLSMLGTARNKKLTSVCLLCAFVVDFFDLVKRHILNQFAVSTMRALACRTLTNLHASS